MRAEPTPRSQFTASGRRSSVHSYGMITPDSSTRNAKIMITENEKLIELVKIYPILYDMKNKDYKDVTKKAEAWGDIAIKMNLQNGAVAKNKWRHLRDSYAKYLRAHSNTTGQYNKKYKHWTWACHMEFLKPHVTTRQSDFSPTGNHSDSDTETRIKSEPSFEKLTEYYEDSQNEGIAPPIKTRKGQQNVNLNLPDETMEYLQTGKIQKNMDALGLLFLSYAQTLKTFSPRRQAAVKLQIAQVINSAEMAQLEEHGSLRFSSSPSPSS